MKHLKNRYTRHLALNTPKAIEERKANLLKRAERKGEIIMLPIGAAK